MKLDSKLKGGLAWAGLVVVLAVPAANVLMGTPIEQARSVTTSDTAVIPTGKPAGTPVKDQLDPIETASVSGKDPVKVYLDKGKKLPSYISDGGASTGAAAPAKGAVAPAKSTDTASLSPGKAGTTELALPAAAPAAAASAPPVPLPRSARPKDTAIAAVAPAQAMPAPVKPAATAPAAAASAADKPLILDEKQVAAAQQAEPFPLSDGNSSDVVREDQLEEWDSGSLADYLERKGLVSGSAAADEAQPVDESQYEGWFVDDGRPVRRQRDELFLF